MQIGGRKISSEIIKNKLNLLKSSKKKNERE